MKKKIILTVLFSALMACSVSAGEWKCSVKGGRTYCTYTYGQTRTTQSCTSQNCGTQSQNCNTQNCTTQNCTSQNCNTSAYIAQNSNASKYINELLQKYYNKSSSYTQAPKTQTTSQTVTEAPTQATTQAPAPPAAQKTTQAQSGSMEQQVVALVNAERAKYGLASLTIDPALSRVAQAKSEDMRDNNYFSHTSPTYGSPFDMMKSFGIKYSAAGENIAKGQKTPQAVVDAWMNSEGHRANILSSSYTKIGVGYAAGNGSVYWSQMFTR